MVPFNRFEDFAAFVQWQRACQQVAESPNYVGGPPFCESPDLQEAMMYEWRMFEGWTFEDWVEFAARVRDYRKTLRPAGDYLMPDFAEHRHWPTAKLLIVLADGINRNWRKVTPQGG